MEILSKTLKDIILDNPEAAAVLERNRLDFCCKGNRTLAEACEQQKLNGQDIAEALLEIRTPIARDTKHFNDWSMNQLLEYILETHHEYIRDKSPFIMAHVRKIAAVHGERHPELHELNSLCLVLLTELNEHMQKEEMVLFPYIEKMLSLEKGEILEKPHFGTIANPIAMMHKEHEEAGDVFAKIYKITDGFTPPRDACTTYKVAFKEIKEFERMLHEHIHLENYLLFPKAVVLETELWA
jgi:regulator of cell morphogenesis and NO signaling